MTKKLHIIEPNLKNMQGHYVRYVVELGQRVQREGFDVICWANDALSTDASVFMSAKKIKIYREFKSGPIIKKFRILRWIMENYCYLQVLRKISKRYSPIDRVLTFSGNLELLFGALVFNILHSSPVSLIFQMMTWETVKLKAKMGFQARIIRSITEMLSKKYLPKTNINLCSQTQPLSEYINRRINHIVGTAPMIVNWHSLKCTEIKIKNADDWPTIGYAGNIRPEKGFHIFALALEHVNIKHRARIQINPVNLEYFEQKKVLCDKLYKLRHVQLFEGIFSQEEYAGFLNSIDIMVFPYDPLQYNLYRSSGIFTEAVGLGKVVIAHRDTWMGYIISKYNIGETFREYYPETLGAVIDSVLLNIDNYKATVEKLKKSWRNQHNIDSFFDQYIRS